MISKPIYSVCNFILFFLCFSACTSRKDPSSYLRSSHRDQPDLVKVSSPNQKNHQHSELGKLEHVIEGKNRENDQLRTRLKHNAKGFEALALTVDHLGKKVSSYMIFFFFFWGGGGKYLHAHRRLGF